MNLMDGILMVLLINVNNIYVEMELLLTNINNVMIIINTHLIYVIIVI